MLVRGSSLLSTGKKGCWIDTVSVELHPLESKPSSLLFCRCAGSFDSAVGAKHAMPWQLVPVILMQQAGYEAVVSRVACCSSDVSIGAHFSWRNREDRPSESLVALCTRVSGPIIQAPPWRRLLLGRRQTEHHLSRGFHYFSRFGRRKLGFRKLWFAPIPRAQEDSREYRTRLLVALRAGLS